MTDLILESESSDSNSSDSNSSDSNSSDSNSPNTTFFSAAPNPASSNLLPSQSKPGSLGLSERPAKRMKFSIDTFSTPIKVLVGESKTEFTIHKGLITQQSEFFKAACNDRWESGRSNVVTLDTECPKLFSIFLTWVYTGALKDATELILPPAVDESSEERVKVSDCRFDQIVKCFILGDYLQSFGFRNAVMDLLVSECRRHSHDTDLEVAGSPRATVVFIYKSTTTESPLRSLIVDNFVSQVSGDDLSDRDDLLNEFYYDALRQSLSAAQDERRSKVWRRDLCTYHEHPDQPDGYRCTAVLI